MSALSLPVRAGDRPRTQLTMPHVQLSQNSTDVLRERLTSWMSDELPVTERGPSEISVPSSIAFFLAPHIRPPEGALLLPPRRTAEFAHIHADGSLHLCLSLEDQQELLDKGWGERHPKYSPENNVLMLYGPRTDEEFDVVKSVIAACYRYATGRTL
ncbi:hypothetical protein HII36_22740 [Nonomuraea sp. NN258]|uniref:luciferase domain-containing protein n=1 Tax=Nonomuraea antri TaxID=2730852 RepID=UPI00156A4403|nr:luciferase family protein [Nonomuraea antri]NRQ34632.1 hypothetical protein [Nonomuraea antri]